MTDLSSRHFFCRKRLSSHCKFFISHRAIDRNHRNKFIFCFVFVGSLPGSLDYSSQSEHFKIYFVTVKLFAAKLINWYLILRTHQDLLLAAFFLISPYISLQPSSHNGFSIRTPSRPFRQKTLSTTCTSTYIPPSPLAINGVATS